MGFRNPITSLNGVTITNATVSTANSGPRAVLSQTTPPQGDTAVGRLAFIGETGSSGMLTASSGLWGSAMELDAGSGGPSISLARQDAPTSGRWNVITLTSAADLDLGSAYISGQAPAPLLSVTDVGASYANGWALWNPGATSDIDQVVPAFTTVGGWKLFRGAVRAPTGGIGAGVNSRILTLPTGSSWAPQDGGSVTGLAWTDAGPTRFELVGNAFSVTTRRMALNLVPHVAVAAGAFVSLFLLYR